jgi:hypothetical protein
MAPPLTGTSLIPHRRYAQGFSCHERIAGNERKRRL